MRKIMKKTLLLIHPLTVFSQCVYFPFAIEPFFYYGHNGTGSSCFSWPEVERATRLIVEFCLDWKLRVLNYSFQLIFEMFTVCSGDSRQHA